MKNFLFTILYCFISLLCLAQAPADFVIPVKVTVNKMQPTITFTWPANADAAAYTVKRKLVTDNSYAAPFATIAILNLNAGTISTYTDMNISIGTMYEYEIDGSFITTLPASRGIYLCAGIDIAPVHSRGTIILLCDNTITAALDFYLNQLNEDLVGDGWKVKRIDVARSNNPHDVVAIKNKVLAAYHENPGTKQLLIIGHVPVPYSGAIFPDSHSNHLGAWPADGYYGDMVNKWTDIITVDTVPSTREENKNRPGDGKFDQSNFTSVQLGVGRVDFSNLPSFAALETDLLKRYFIKNHAFRMGAVNIGKKALIEDNFLSYSEKFSQGTWKSFAATAGYDKITLGQYETDLLSPGGYLWSYGTGAGTYTDCSAVAHTSDFVTQSYKTVFTQLFGSYFGDWDSQDNLMRASLASAGNTLACVWGGRPQWFLHHMSAGYPIGYSTLLTMNNKSIYTNTGSDAAMVHIGLMGDPSLRSSYTKPVSNLRTAVNKSAVDINWDAAAETAISGYNIYRAATVNDEFLLLTNNPVIANNFTDNSPLTGNNVYMVRTVKADTIIIPGAYSNSSTYYNMAQGVFDSLLFSNIILPVKLISFAAKVNSNCSTVLQWKTTNENNLKGYIIEYSQNSISFQQAGNVSASSIDNAAVKEYNFQHHAFQGKAYYRIKMMDRDGRCQYSNIIALPINCTKTAVLIYPNPVHDFLSINITLASGTFTNTAALYDAAGKLLCKKILRNGTNTIDMASLPKGLYNLKLVIDKEVKNYKVGK